eukprot:5384520-Pyramimonas_sp.AAC.1
MDWPEPDRELPASQWREGHQGRAGARLCAANIAGAVRFDPTGDYIANRLAGQRAARRCRTR